MKLTVPQIFAGVVSLMVTVAVVAGFIVAGSPALERARLFDDQRTSALQQIANGVGAYTEKRETVPATLADLQTAASKNIGIYLPETTDPLTKTPYEYAPTGTLTYRLCAVFQAEPRPKVEQVGTPYYAGEKSASGVDFNQHGVGQKCWDIDLTEQVSDAKAAAAKYPPGTVIPEPAPIK